MDGSVTQDAQPERSMVCGGRCYECYRPLDICFCHLIPSIDNQTEVLIMQHRREQFHRFNTARIVQKALRNSQLLADHTQNLAHRLRLKPGAGLLYPGPTAKLIADLPASERPQQLVVVDGTWHHTKTLVRDIPALQALPRYQLSPSAPGRYRIRREPNATALSTVEAAVAALRILEPDTQGFEQLLQAFESMVDVQLAHPGSIGPKRCKARRGRTLKYVPRALQGSLENIVVAYGEATPGEPGSKKVAGPPIAWVAQRLGDGTTFACTLIPPQPLGEVFLGHLELTQADFATALPLTEARRRWAEFQRPGDLVVVLHPGTARLYSHLIGRRTECLLLKSIPVSLLSGQTDLAELPAAAELHSSTLPPLGRATRRLAEAIALVKQLHELATHWGRDRASGSAQLL